MSSTPGRRRAGVRPAAELSNDELRREAEEHLKVSVAHELQRRTGAGPAVSDDACTAALVRLMWLRREAHRRARLN